MAKAFVEKQKNTAIGLLDRFTRNETGDFAIIFGLTLPVLMMSAGVAFDYSRISHAQGLMDSALDAAILSVGHELSDGENNEDVLRGVFDDFLAANLEGRSLTPLNISVESFEVDPSSGKVAADITGDVKMGMMSIAGYDKVAVDSSSAAIFSTNPVEIAMMLDVTGSMNTNDKIGSLKVAAVDAINTLIPASSSSDRVRIGLVPYSWSVNAGSYAQEVKGESSVSFTGNCVTERRIDTFKDTSYTMYPLEGHARVTDDNKCPTAEIVPLTTDRSKLIDEIEGFNAAGYTAGHLGIAWTYYMLSEKWQSLWPDSADPADYGDGTKKIAVLMTDGEFNTYFEGTDDDDGFGGQFDESNDAAVETCEQMKKLKGGFEGITIYSIAFDAPASAQATLQSCATPDTDRDQFYYSADNEEELREAFLKIAQSIKNLRLSR